MEKYIKVIPPSEINVSEYDDYRIVWNIDELRRYCKCKNPIYFGIDEVDSIDNTVNIEYAKTLQNDEPIIVLKHNDGHFEVLDGKHRVAKAKQDGKKSIAGYCLKENEANRFIFDKN